MAEKRPLLSGKMPRVTEYHTFNADGSYTLESGEIKINGQWKWVDESEIYLQINSIAVANRQDNFDSTKSSYHLRILEVSENKLKTLEKFETDAWNSGFAKERTYSHN